jgi:hypothetical protein
MSWTALEQVSSRVGVFRCSRQRSRFHPDRRGRKASKVRRAFRVLKGQQDPKALKVRKVTADLRGHKVHRAIAALRALKDLKDQWVR